MKNLFLLSLLLWTSTAGAFAGFFDSSFELENGYYYNDIGSTFITRRADETESQIIPSEVENYMKWRGNLLVVQATDSTQYWVLNMHTHKLERFNNLEDFKTRARRLGMIDDNIWELLSY